MARPGPAPPGRGAGLSSGAATARGPSATGRSPSSVPASDRASLSRGCPGPPCRRCVPGLRTPAAHPVPPRFHGGVSLRPHTLAPAFALSLGRVVPSFLPAPRRPGKAALCYPSGTFPLPQAGPLPSGAPGAALSPARPWPQPPSDWLAHHRGPLCRSQACPPFPASLPGGPCASVRPASPFTPSSRLRCFQAPLWPAQHSLEGGVRSAPAVGCPRGSVWPRCPAGQRLRE